MDCGRFRYFQRGERLGVGNLLPPLSPQFGFSSSRLKPILFRNAIVKLGTPNWKLKTARRQQAAARHIKRR
jgi:hypothetical protein